MEAATKQYGVPLLISEHIFRYFSPRLQAICRKIDCVALKGSHESLGLFTLDLDVENLPPSKNKENISKDEITEMNWIKKNAFFEGLEVGAFEVEEVLDNDKAMKMMLKTFNINFHEVFKRGMEYYIQGNWIKAKEKFEEGLIKKIDDGPCKTLLVFMQKSFFIKPEDWKGFRELTEK